VWAIITKDRAVFELSAILELIFHFCSRFRSHKSLLFVYGEIAIKITKPTFENHQHGE